MIWPLVGSVLAASLVGSPHCVGMCGGFVCFYSGQAGASRRTHAAYHLGRLGSYAALGAIAGALGTGLDALGAQAGVHRLAVLASGLVLLLWGGATLLRAGGRVDLPGPVRAALRVPVAASMRAAHAWPPAARALTLGLVTTLLPCGWLWLFAATAGGTGSPARGALVMAAFWLGTVPLLAGFGLAAQHALGPLRRRLPLVSGTALVVLGLLTIGGKLHANAHGAACHKAGAACCETRR